MNEERGYCECCKIFYQCFWFCKKEIDEDNNPIEPCYTREYIKDTSELFKCV